MSSKASGKKEREPAYTEILKYITQLAQKSKYVKIESAGKSFEGREIPVVFVTDFEVSPENKQLVFITAGIHGSEEAGRAAGLAALEYLGLGAPKETLKKQLFVIFPCVNPDGSIRDIYHNAQDINIARDFDPKKESKTPEAKTVFEYAKKYIPDICLDLHGLAGGAMKESLFMYADFPSNINGFVSSTIALKAKQEAERAGYPQGETAVHGIFTEGVKCLSQACISSFNSLGFVLNLSQDYYTIKENRECGLAYLKEILSWGNKKSFSNYYPGYPVNIISGSSMWGFVSNGSTAERRRENRRDVFNTLKWIPALDRVSPDKDGCALLRFEVTGREEKVPDRYGVQCRFHHEAKIKSVTVNNRKLKEKPGEDGYIIWRDSCSKFVLLSVSEPLQPGKYEIKIRYDIKFFKK